MLSSAEYFGIIGEEAPDGFLAMEQMALQQLHARTGFMLVGRTLNGYPLELLKRALAYQVQFIHQAGGVASMTEADEGSVTLGRYSHIGGVAGATDKQLICPMVTQLLPALMAFGRGMRCDAADS